MLGYKLKANKKQEKERKTLTKISIWFILPSKGSIAYDSYKYILYIKETVCKKKQQKF
jgi:hypothetical protein